jgi:hypothetical protein
MSLKPGVKSIRVVTLSTSRKSHRDWTHQASCLANGVWWSP